MRYEFVYQIVKGGANIECWAVRRKFRCMPVKKYVIEPIYIGLVVNLRVDYIPPVSGTNRCPGTNR